jgi:hypothetical protein
MDEHLEEMNPSCKVGLCGSPDAIEDLWKYVYLLKEEMKKLEAHKEEQS